MHSSTIKNIEELFLWNNSRDRKRESFEKVSKKYLSFSTPKFGDLALRCAHFHVQQSCALVRYCLLTTGRKARLKLNGKKNYIKMMRYNICRSTSAKIVEVFSPCLYNPLRYFSKQNNEPAEMHFNEQQTSYYTAKDIEFCPNRAKEVMQNYVQETSENTSCDESTAKIDKTDSGTLQYDKDHMNMYQSGNSVSLYSVMQSNVPEPFTTKDKAPTHLNMPGSSSTQDYKYLSEKIQNTHQSKQ